METERFALELCALTAAADGNPAWPVNDVRILAQVRQIADALVPSARVFIASFAGPEPAAVDIGIIGTRRPLSLPPDAFPFSGPPPADPIVLVRMDGPPGRVRVEAFVAGARNGHLAGYAAVVETGGGPPSHAYFLDGTDFTPVLANPRSTVAAMADWPGRLAFFASAHPRILGIVAACEEDGSAVSLVDDTEPGAILHSAGWGAPYIIVRHDDFRAFRKEQTAKPAVLLNVRLGADGSSSIANLRENGLINGTTARTPAVCGVQRQWDGQFKITEHYWDAGVRLAGPREPGGTSGPPL